MLLRNIDVQGWLRTARRTPSPNHDARPAGVSVELVVIHCISLPEGTFGSPHVEALFLNCLDPGAAPGFEDLCELQVSAHLFIDRSGAVVQFVPFHARAWHAGISSLNGRGRCNDFSIGIELEGTDTSAFTEAQYQALGAVLRVIRADWPSISVRDIVGHSDIAPGRKTDPGIEFDWSRVRRDATLATDSQRDRGQ
jgi:AmpD protein